MHLFVLASELDLRDNTTCQLVRGEVTGQVNIFSLEPDSFARLTPLEGFFSSARLASTPHRTVHTSDALRYLLLYKYGGFYLGKHKIVI